MVRFRRGSQPGVNFESERAGAKKKPAGRREGRSAYGMRRTGSPRGGAGRGGASASGAGSFRAEPSRAEPSCEVPGRGRQSLPAAPHPSCCVSRLGVPLPLPRHRQNFYCLGDPPGCVTKSQRSAVSSPSSPATAIEGTCNPRSRALAPCASSPADRSRELRGGDPQRDRAGNGTPKSCSPLLSGSAQL